MRRSPCAALGLTVAVFAAIAQGQVNQTITSVTDPYTGGSKLAPGGLALIQGTFLGQNPTVTIASLKAYTVVPPFLNNGRSMVVQIPVDAPLGTSDLVVTLASGPLPAFPVSLTTYAPVAIAATAGSFFSPAHTSGLPVTANTPAAPGETVIVSAIGLGPTSPTVATGSASPAGANTLAAVSVTLGGVPVGGAMAALAPGSIGIYQVSFMVPPGTAAGKSLVNVTVGGATSNGVTLSVGPAPTAPAVATVVDQASGGAALCPGDLASIYGLNFGANPSVTFSGKAAYVVSGPANNQVTVEIPVDAATGTANVVVTAGGQSSAPVSVNLSAVAPALFGTPVHASSGAPVTPSNPALPNETITLTAIGLGATSPVVPTGTPAPANTAVVNPPAVLLAGATINNAAATLAPGQVGVYQVSFTLRNPPPTGNAVLLRLQGGPVGAVAGSNILTIAIALSLAAPAINGLDNIYSYLQPGAPNYGIAQGSIFSIFGSNLAQGMSNGLQSAPLPLKLQQASVSVSVNGTTTQAPLYYASPGQLVAILPSSTPAGDGTITVNNGNASGSAGIHVVQSAFGILTLNQGGSGPAAAFDANYDLLGFTQALNPGDYFVLWGTGLGPIAGDDAQVPAQANLDNVPITLEVGGIPAQVAYHGRSAFAGLDQVVGIVPQGVTPGCWVSVSVRSGRIVSNFATLPVAPTGRVCTDPTMGLTASMIQTLASKGSIQAGFLELRKNGAAVPNGGGFGLAVNDIATAQFFSVNRSDFAAFTLGPSIGSCIVSRTYSSDAPWGRLTSTPLDAGTAIDVTGPGGQAQAGFQSNLPAYFGANGIYMVAPEYLPWQGGGGAYIGVVGGATQAGNAPPFVSDTGGDPVTFANGGGGSAVGGFQVATKFLSSVFSLPQAATLPLSTVSLSTGFTVNWSNADPNSFVQITGRSTGGTGGAQATVQFTCAAPASAGQFTIPQAVLLSLPSETAIAANPAFTAALQIGEMGFPQAFSALGIDIGLVRTSVLFTAPVYFQ